MTPTQILDLPMRANGPDAATISCYLLALLKKLWREGEGFSGKRPFGNSRWEWDLYAALVAGGVVKGEVDEDGHLVDCDRRAADAAIFSAIEALY